MVQRQLQFITSRFSCTITDSFYFIQFNVYVTTVFAYFINCYRLRVIVYEVCLDGA